MYYVYCLVSFLFRCYIKHSDALLQIREETTKHFHEMSIEQFCSLFKAFKVYRVSTLEDFLKSVTLPPKLCICDTTWQAFLYEVVERFSGASTHFFLGPFMESVGQAYANNRHAQEFIEDILRLKVPKLLALEEDNQTEEDAEVPKKFSSFLHSYINSHALKDSLLKRMKTLLVSTILVDVFVNMQCSALTCAKLLPRFNFVH